MKYSRLCVIFFMLTVTFVLLVQFDFVKKIDLLFYQWSYSISNPITDIFWRVFTLLGDTEMLAVLSLIVVAFLLWQKKIHEVILYLFIMSSGILITLFLKLIMKKERPGEVEYIDFWGLGNNTVSYSFPSGHAVKSLLLFGFLIWLIRQYYQENKYTFMTLFVMAIMFCGLGQIFLLEHYISDVIGGYLIGFTCLLFYLWMYRRYGARPQSRKE